MSFSRLRFPCLVLVAFGLTVVTVQSHVLAQQGGDTSNGKSVLAAGAKIEKIDIPFELCDGPAWDGSWGLYIPDVKGQKLVRYIPRTKQSVTILPKQNAAAGRFSATFFSHGKLYISENSASRIIYLNGTKKVVVAQHDPAAKPPARPNDLVVDHNEGVYYTLTGPGQVWYARPPGKDGKRPEKQLVIKEIKTPNGIILSPDNKTLYVSAYVPKQVWQYDVKPDGSLSEGKLFSKMDEGPDRGADGMTIDRAGNVYCTGPSHVWVWSPNGKLIDKIKTPTRPINATFAGPDPQQLYITCLGDKKNNIPSEMVRIKTRIFGVSPHVSLSKSAAADLNNKRPDAALPDGVAAQLDVTYATYGQRKMLADIFTPKEKSSKARPAIVVVHGGGWLKGDKSKFRALAINLAKRGYVTAAIEYRLGGEAKFPAGIHDCNAAVRFFRANADQYGIDKKRIGAVGGSAGGHLVGLMATGWKIKQLQGEGGNVDQSSELQAAIVMAGPMEINTGSVAQRSKTSADSNSVHWIGGSVDDQPKLYRLASAYQHIDKDSSPTLFMVGEHDKPERNQPARDRFKVAGVESGLKVYKDGKHGCWNQLPWFNDMTQDMDVFFKEKLK